VRKGRLLAAALVLALPGCGGHTASSPSAVVRAWSKALNAGQNDRAADLFASGAEVVQDGSEIRLRGHRDAVDFNRALPCSGRIVELRTRGNLVTATFVLGDRESSRCDGPGQRARAVFRVRGGKIVLWHQLPGPATVPTTPVV
jgi:limonene-1,2-epoxide hydrolase